MNKEYKSLFKLAKEINKLFPSFYLAGGTALMFRHKHRISVDLDFFSQKPFSYARLSTKIRKNFINDAAFLYKKYHWNKKQIKNDFEKKFPNQSFELFLGALINFNDYPKLNKWIKKELIKLIE